MIFTGHPGKPQGIVMREKIDEERERCETLRAGGAGYD